MKKICFLLLVLSCRVSHAQNVLPVYDPDQYGFEPQPANLYLQASKNLCELNETINVNVRMLMTDKNSEVPYHFEYKFRDFTDAPWQVGDFKIISGGGRIIMTDGNVAQIQMPATMPKEKAVLVQVTMKPIIPKYAQVQLFTTIYLEDNDNVFYFNCSYLGINNEKYVVKFNGGALANSDASAKKAIDKNIAQAKKKAGEYSMKAAAGEVAATSAGFDLSQLTSNAKAIYAPDDDVTTILFNSDNIEMVNGVKTSSKRMYSIVLSFPGKTTGSFKIKANKKVTATVTLPTIYPGYACTCADDPDDPHHPSCLGGTIEITKYNGKEIEGRIMGYLESQDGTKNPPPTFYSTLNGKFKVQLAN
ncbi:MAG: hypothetical protein JST86_07090 [Bacteroidetes bacterium]|nr:hypothetical protein [Bacteroidota bacterium]